MSEKSTFDILDFTYKAVMEWLKFAEQKTAGLLILNSGVIWAYLRLLNKQEIAYSWLSYVNVVYLVLLILSSVICIVSLTPVLDSFWYFDAGKNKDKNAFYFKDIATLDEYSYLKLLSESNQANSFNKKDIDLAKQIVINSKITTIKYSRFKFSSVLSVLCFVCIGLVQLISYVGGS